MKAFYDQYGEEKLKSAYYGDGLVGGYRFKNNSQEVFDNFFGDKNPFSQIYNNDGYSKDGSVFGSAFGNKNFAGTIKPKDLVVKVHCTLYEIYNGCFKEVVYKRQILKNDGRSTTTADERKTIQICRSV